MQLAFHRFCILISQHILLYCRPKSTVDSKGFESVELFSPHHEEKTPVERVMFGRPRRINPTPVDQLEGIILQKLANACIKTKFEMFFHKLLKICSIFSNTLAISFAAPLISHKIAQNTFYFFTPSCI